MRGLDRRLEQLQPELLERQRPQVRRAERERVDRRADVVAVARERQLRGAGAAADLAGPLDDEHRAAGPSELDRRGETVRAGSDDDRVDRQLQLSRRKGRATRRIGAVVMCMPERIPEFCQTFPARDHCRLRSTQTACIETSPSAPR